MSEAFEIVARSVIKRIASINPGHQETITGDIQAEFDTAFCDAAKDYNARMASPVWETFDKPVPEN